VFSQEQECLPCLRHASYEQEERVFPSSLIEREARERERQSLRREKRQRGKESESEEWRRGGERGVRGLFVSAERCRRSFFSPPLRVELEERQQQRGERRGSECRGSPPSVPHASPLPAEPTLLRLS